MQDSVDKVITEDMKRQSIEEEVVRGDQDSSEESELFMAIAQPPPNNIQQPCEEPTEEVYEFHHEEANHDLVYQEHMQEVNLESWWIVPQRLPTISEAS